MLTTKQARRFQKKADVFLPEIEGNMLKSILEEFIKDYILLKRHFEDKK